MTQGRRGKGAVLSALRSSPDPLASSIALPGLGRSGAKQANKPLALQMAGRRCGGQIPLLRHVDNTPCRSKRTAVPAGGCGHVLFNAPDAQFYPDRPDRNGEVSSRKPGM
ncbi:hypothetical protein MHIB_03780 [Mycolicibacter hiberniae]|uniref:Uncharacterized protein n=1 Tax=Mycolicibacter hiberniae TaxID=29314 RepID=A0A7I7WXU4_9MYCO|nr:hypothetical protein MHIB_03780 [Mycolicibacter hiberniae]